MTIREKYITRAILAISLIMLIGGIAGSIYCAYRINERLDWLERERVAEYYYFHDGLERDGEYYYRQDVKAEVTSQVTSLGIYLAVSADIAVFGGLTGLSVVSKRFRWGGVKGVAFSLLGVFIIIPLIIGAIYFWMSGEKFFTLVMVFLFILAIALFFGGEKWMQGTVFILGGLFVMLGIFIAINCYIWFILNRYDGSELVLFFMVIGIGLAMAGAGITLSAVYGLDGKSINQR